MGIGGLYSSDKVVADVRRSLPPSRLPKIPTVVFTTDRTKRQGQLAQFYKIATTDWTFDNGKSRKLLGLEGPLSVRFEGHDVDGFTRGRIERIFERTMPMMEAMEMKARKKSNPYRLAVTDSKLAVNTTCHFLRVPAEIRLNIYRCLLLESPRASLDPSCPEKAFDAMTDRIQQRSTLDALLDQYLEESGLIDEIESYDPEGEGSVMYNHLALNQSNPHWEIPSPPAIDEEEFIQGAGVTQD
ncbi:hypothetical protein HO173_005446 [Letharia columbiana]|uniref:Uncharacterized protein n=1 Tax=Letharia columbiana TaxID=112416 RepID=A0A8H6FX70_9LECA|nr:uncharacterized protein HO173_005446 [Letharia columbiana]KAF6236355.1 hypothetical protein HO173_005446 [Letharia columbiana]